MNDQTNNRPPPARASLTARLESSGLRLTAQRRIIAECLAGIDRHVSASQLLSEAKDRLPEIGRATVYKALAAFVASGEVAEVDVGSGVTLYDPNADLVHDHLVCTSCQQIWDSPRSRPQEASGKPAASEHDFRIDSTEVTHFGQCQSCVLSVLVSKRLVGKSHQDA